MAQTNIEFSSVFQMPAEAAAWFIELIKCYEAFLNEEPEQNEDGTHDYPEDIREAAKRIASDCDSCSPGMALEPGILLKEDGTPDTDNTQIIVWSEDGDTVEPLIAALYETSVKFQLAEPFGFEYAFTCSKPRVGEFGGGCVLVSKDGVASKTTSDILAIMIEGYKAL
jgi:hypothetical protein